TTPDGTTRHYSYNTAGQLTRLEDSQEGTWEYIYDGLGRRIRATTPDGCVNHYAYATGGGLPGEIRSTHPHQGALEGCSERCAASTGAALWVDALGQVAGVRSAAGDCFLSWDVTGSVPSVVGVAGVPVSLGAGVAGVPTGVRGVDP
ncbi:RHS repeat domain-containing protein, partial [Rothia nasimurium]